MRIFGFKSKGYKEFLPSMAYVSDFKSLTIGWLCWFIEFTTDEVYGNSREKESYIKVIK